MSSGLRMGHRFGSSRWTAVVDHLNLQSHPGDSKGTSSTARGTDHVGVLSNVNRYYITQWGLQALTPLNCTGVLKNSRR